MNKKIYTAPKINVVEMCCTTIMAGSGEYKIEEDGVISYVLINMLCMNWKKLNPTLYVLAILFVIKYIFI